MVNRGNRGEWAEIYIFLRLAAEGKIYMADENMQRLASTYLKIIKILREEIPGNKVEYVIQDPIKIIENNVDIGPDTSKHDYEQYANETWNMIECSKKGNGLFDARIAAFLERIHINKLKAPAQSSADFFGGTEDIVMEVEDYRSGINSIMGFSCKSKFNSEATLFNSSHDNTNFRYRIIGNINDVVMNTFNSMFNIVNKKDKNTGVITPTEEVSVSERMEYLKLQGCDLEFVRNCVETARRNLIQSGGMEMPLIVGEMLKYYFFIHNGKTKYENISKALRYLAANDPVGYAVDDLMGMYKTKVGTLLYNMFTGMKMGSVWNGRQSVTGGYICAKKDGDVVAYHANVADVFRDFLIKQLSFETSSAKKHNYMRIEKVGNEYFINLNMQIRFTDSEVVKLENSIEKLKSKKKKLIDELDQKKRTLEKRVNAKKPNPDTILKAQNKVDVIQQSLIDKENELETENGKLQRLLSGNGDY